MKALSLKSTARLVPFALLALLASANATFGDLITGRVVDSNGVGVPGVNIDAIRVSNGNDQNLSNDGTNTLGNFSTTIAAGVYDLYFFAPVPPQTTLVPLVLRNVVVTGTKALGNLTMQSGVSLSGTVRNPGGAPVSQVTLRVIDELTGADVPLATRKTSAFGTFSLAVPARALELQLDASSVPVQLLVSRVLNVAPTTNTNLGALTLAQGFLVTGHVQRAVNATAVPSVDLDIVDKATGEKLFTPHDNTDTLGNFSIVLPTGAFDVELCPPFATRLVARSLPHTVTGTSDLGVIALDPGFVLSGTIRSFNGTAQVGSDVDVRNRLTRAKVFLCADNSGANGAYSIIVPAGTMRVIFHPPSFTLGLGSQVHKNVAVNGDTFLDGVLPVCGFPTNYGTGLAGTGGVVPQIRTIGGVATPDNSDFALRLQNGRGGGMAVLTLSGSQQATPLAGGILLVGVDPCCSLSVPLILNGASGVAGAGNQDYKLPFPLHVVMGLDIFAQYFVIDPLAPQGWSFSEGLRLPVCR